MALLNPSQSQAGWQLKGCWVPVKLVMLLLICISSVEDFTNKTPLASSLHLLQQRGSPLTATTPHPITHPTLGHRQAFAGTRCLEWTGGSSQSSTQEPASPLMGILKSPMLFHKLIHHPKILHPAPAFAFQSQGRKIPPPTTPALNGKVPSPMFTAALPKCLLLSCFSLNTCPSCLVWVRHELTGSYVIVFPAQHILLLIVMQSIIFTCIENSILGALIPKILIFQ